MSETTVARLSDKANPYGFMSAMLASQIYLCGDAQDVIDGKWKVSNVNPLDGKKGLGLIVWKGRDIVADCRMNADRPDGVSDLELADETAGHRTRKKICDLLRNWVSLNRQAVYPAR